MTDKHSKSIFYVRTWLGVSAFMVFAMAVIGAITRLTESGLSMVEWRPLIGAIPPLSADEWNRVFALYQQTPEYQKINSGMSVDEFKGIFFWEWFHRLWGRLIGLVYGVPLLIFWIRGMIPSNMKAPLFGLLVLGGLQGVVGYIMVLSGFIDNPSVSHYRLALHLMLAWAVYVGLIWCYLRIGPNVTMQSSTHCQRRHGWFAMAFLAVTIIWGAFVAGMDAGLIYNEWPHMGQGRIVPSEMWFLSPVIANLVENAAGIQFIHRWIAALTLVLITSFAWRVKDFWLGGMVFVQFGLGLMTLLSQVAIPLAAMHQAGAFVLTALLLNRIYRIRKIV